MTGPRNERTIRLISPSGEQHNRRLKRRQIFRLKFSSTEIPLRIKTQSTSAAHDLTTARGTEYLAAPSDFAAVQRKTLDEWPPI
jgi:hypothetical protein